MKLFETNIYWRWNSQTTHLDLQRCRIYSLITVSEKLPWFFFSVRRKSCKNFEECGWFFLIWKKKKNAGAEILKRRKVKILLRISINIFGLPGFHSLGNYWMFLLRFSEAWRSLASRCLDEHSTFFMAHNMNPAVHCLVSWRRDCIPRHRILGSPPTFTWRGNHGHNSRLAQGSS